MTCRLAREVLPTVCAWCVKAGRVEDVPGGSHGICTACKEELLATVRTKREPEDAA